MEQLEIEVKFHLADPEHTRRRILDTGALSQGRVFETNIRFEPLNHSLLASGALLRLRREQKTTLTFKSPSPEADTEFKVMREIEVQVSDFEAMAEILQALGYRKEQIYEKWRETFVSQEALICLDKLPFGDFLEIEGSRAAILDLAKRLGLAWETRVLANYLEMFAFIQDQVGLDFCDVTFANFGKHVVVPTSCITRFEARNRSASGNRAGKTRP
jgi:adenylate cyclase class 2